MIKIINYGLGNVRAFYNVYKCLNIPVAIANNANELDDASRLILPGVGAFDHAMRLLQQSGMREKLDNLVLTRGMPILGVCVGMQILAETSEEGCLKGLGWIAGSIDKLTGLEKTQYLPHMGWNDVQPLGSNRLFSGLETEARFYFLHSYHFNCQFVEAAIAVTEYGRRFVSAVNDKNVYGVQFHPEKSHHFGARLLENFARI